MGLSLSSLTNLDDATFELLAMIIKILIVIVIGLQVAPIMLWIERKVPALMQRRKGPNRVGLFNLRLWGLMQALADAIKMMFKEEIVPASAFKFFYHLAPVLCVYPAFLTLSAIPFGQPLQVLGREVSLQVINLNVGFLFILAISGLGIYGIVLAGWASNNKYALLGAIRASAQMVSYEIPLGLSLVPIVLIYDSLDLNHIANAQANFFHWGIFLAPISFVIFLICMFAETNRVPFDLAEGESELVAGFHTEFASMKFAAFFLSEYIVMFMLSLLCSLLFFGGWNLPFISFQSLIDFLGHHNLAVAVGVVALFLKAAFFMWFYVWVRWTIPRFRYDQLMKLSWKFLLPLGLANIVVTAFVLALQF